MNRAKELFGASPRQHNCAQAVVCGFGRDDLKEAFASCGGGHAPEGRCGALHAAMSLVPEKAEQIRAEFVASLGAETCKALKGELRVPCPLCVETAAALVERFQS